MSRPKLSNRLQALLSHEHPKGITIASLVHAMGEQGFGILCLFLSMPSALPIPAPGYSTPFGIVICLLGLQMILCRNEPWLPEKARNIVINKKLADKMLRSTIWFLKKIEHWIYPRLSFVCGKRGKIFMGILLVVMSCIRIIPIPLTSTLPAMIIFLMAVGLVEDDGLICLLACCAGFIAFCIYSAALFIFIVYGLQGLIHVKEWIVAFAQQIFNF